MSAPNAEWCDLTELPCDQCSHCRGLDATYDASLKLERPQSFIAQFSDVCVDCENAIVAGERITPTGHGYGYRCEGCAHA